MHSKSILFFVLFTVIFLQSGCGWKRIHRDTEAEDNESSKSSTKTENLSKLNTTENLAAALSRAQSRIEELDAKFAALSDKVDSTRLAVDNLNGNKPLKTVAVGSANEVTASSNQTALIDNNKKDQHEINSHTEDNENSKSLLKMDKAISDFMKAMSTFKSGKFSDAELEFNHFSEQYPDHILAGSAQFYSGESYYNLGEYKLAINEYNKVVASFGSSPRVSSAMVRIAQCYEHIGNTGEANRTLTLAKELFDGSPVFDMLATAKAKKELSSTPIEPEQHTKQGHNKKSQQDDSELDAE